MKRKSAAKQVAVEQIEAKAKGGGLKVVEDRVVIEKPDLRVAAFRLVGTAPYVQNKFSTRIRQQIHNDQEAGSQAKSKKKREPKDFQKLFEEATYRGPEGWCGVPASCFRNAMISACKLVGYHMTKGKLSIFVLADGLDADGTPLIKLEGKREYNESVVRNESGVIDLRARPMWREWSCTIRVRFDAGQFSTTDVANLLMRAGMQVGIGEGRPDSKNSNGMGWGTFTVE